MLGKCANPSCAAPFRKLGNGKLFAFEPGIRAKSADSVTSAVTKARSPVFFWLCECCSLSFTLRLDGAGQLTVQRVPDGVGVTSPDGHPFDHGW
jgi:hypothetical protein